MRATARVFCGQPSPTTVRESITYYLLYVSIDRADTFVCNAARRTQCNATTSSLLTWLACYVVSPHVHFSLAYPRPSLLCSALVQPCTGGTVLVSLLTSTIRDVIWIPWYIFHSFIYHP